MTGETTGAKTDESMKKSIDDTEILNTDIGGESHSTSMQCIPIQDHPYFYTRNRQEKSSPTQPLIK